MSKDKDELVRAVMVLVDLARDFGGSIHHKAIDTLTAEIDRLNSEVKKNDQNG